MFDSEARYYPREYEYEKWLEALANRLEAEITKRLPHPDSGSLVQPSPLRRGEGAVCS
jgi:hypothetical protein